MTSIIDIEGIGSVFAKKLENAGVKSVEALLKAGATPKGREILAEKTGIDKGKILEWVNHADLSASKASQKNMLICWKRLAWTQWLNFLSASQKICTKSYWKLMGKRN